ncbi:MAG: YwbE family protein [bacterium]
MLSIYNLIIFEDNKNQYRENIRVGSKVKIVTKKDQKSGKLTSGKVEKILTSKRKHTRGIKVRLDDGQVGRVQKIIKY